MHRCRIFSAVFFILIDLHLGLAADVERQKKCAANGWDLGEFVGDMIRQSLDDDDDFSAFDRGLATARNPRVRAATNLQRKLRRFMPGDAL